ncbi:MAG TPA: methyltransferase domain-containing protein, partial [Candidatus Nanopelagicales bacterium]|nr:methyltransferase domain-containing protein [Candidatus Nanopelagicales bacterium]
MTRPDGGASDHPPGDDGDPYAAARTRMVETQLRARGVRDPRVLAAMAAVPREAFVPARLRDLAYADEALPIEHGQTISQPLMVALMSELLAPEPGDRVLDVGTGSGYQAAVLAAMGCRVTSVERVPELAATARERLAALGFGDRVEVRV